MIGKTEFVRGVCFFVKKVDRVFQCTAHPWHEHVCGDERIPHLEEEVDHVRECCRLTGMQLIRQERRRKEGEVAIINTVSLSLLTGIVVYGHPEITNLYGKFLSPANFGASVRAGIDETLLKKLSKDRWNSITQRCWAYVCRQIKTLEEERVNSYIREHERERFVKKQIDVVVALIKDRVGRSIQGVGDPTFDQCSPSTLGPSIGEVALLVDADLLRDIDHILDINLAFEPHNVLAKSGSIRAKIYSEFFN